MTGVPFPAGWLVPFLVLPVALVTLLGQGVPPCAV